MKITKPLKIIGIVGLSLILLTGILNIAINLLIKNQLPKIIQEKNDTAYELTFKDMNFSIFRNSLSVSDVKLIPKKNSDIKKDIDFYGNVDEISVSGVNFYELIKNKNLKAFTISVIGPHLTILKQAEKDTLKTESKLTSIIDIDKISVQKAYLKMMNTAGDSLLHEIYNFNVEIDGIHMGNYTVKKDIPFTYTNYKFKIDSVYSVINDLQIAKSGTIDIDKENIFVNNFKLQPYVSSKEFRNNDTESNTRLYVDVPKLSLKNTDWGYNNFNLFVKIEKIDIDSIQVKILDQKAKTVFQQAKKEVEKIVQPLIPFRLDVTELNIKKSAFNSLQTLDVKNVNIKIKNISNRVEEHLLIDEFQLNNPVFVQIPKKNRIKKTNNSSKLNDVVLINKILVNNANYTLKDESGKRDKLTVADFKLSLQNIRVDDKTILENIPFSYQNSSLSTGKIHFDAGRDYNIYSNGISTNAKNAVINDFKMLPKMSHNQHVKQLKYAQDHYNISTKTIQLNNINWGFDKQNEFFIKFKEVVLNNMDASIYRDISVPLNPKENHLYGYRLRNIKFPFEVQSLKIKNSKLSYEENPNNDMQSGKLLFTNFNLTANNLYSGYKKSSGPSTQIFVQTKFMNQGDLIASWQFDILDSKERFNINGDLKNFPATAMDPFLKPYMNVKATGKIDHMAFNFSGNNDIANGQYAMNFQNLKMTIFNKENKEKKLLSAAANALVRTDTDGLKKVEIKPIERTKNKSFFNFLWLCIMQGLKQTVI